MVIFFFWFVCLSLVANFSFYDIHLKAGALVPPQVGQRVSIRKTVHVITTFHYNVVLIIPYFCKS